MEIGKHEILKNINDLDLKHKQLKQEVFELLDQIKTLEDLVNKKLIEIDDIEKNYVDLMTKLVE